MKTIPVISLFTLLISAPLVCLADNSNAAKYICDALKNFTIVHPGLAMETTIPITVSYDNFASHNNQLSLTKRASFHFMYRPSICQTEINRNFHSFPDSYSKFRIMLDNVPIDQGVVQP
ncbi:MAG: hypothetical protein P1U63_12465 [Coxiellaceae bacterium]|nr:hypothetical protein [Coxiellaceae bacterium]